MAGMMKHGALRLTAFSALFLMAAAQAQGQSQGADPALIEAARREGSVTWYTTLIISQFVRPASAAFEKKYGVKVNAIRMNTEDVILRVSNEAKAGRVQADVFDGTSTVGPLKKLGIVAKYTPPAAMRLPKQFIDKEGFWAATNYYVYTPALNTELWPESKAPKTFNDLLDPMYKGKFGWSSLSSTSSAPGFVGTVLTHMGEEKGMDFLRKLVKQDIIPIKLSARSVVDKMISGEFAIALQTFNHHSTISAAKGAPSKWFPLDLAMVNVSVEGVSKDAPHPNAARLLVNFLVTPEGQQLFKAAGYMPVDPDILPDEPRLQPERGGFKAFLLTPEEVDERLPGWQKIAVDLFR